MKFWLQDPLQNCLVKGCLLSSGAHHPTATGSPDTLVFLACCEAGARLYPHFADEAETDKTICLRFPMLTKWRQALNLGILTWDPLLIPARLGAFG